MEKICKKKESEYDGTMNMFFLISVVFALYLWVYLALFFIFRSSVQKIEWSIVDIFLSKVAKIPALVEVMRPYVVDEKAFETICSLHSDIMIHRHDTIYDLLEYNARIQNQFLFLLQLSVQIPELQKHEYFLYIRDFIISYERSMYTKFSLFNHAVSFWNIFVLVKNWTIIGLLLPWRSRIETR